ncbi:hypothetical protein ACGRHY_27915 [Streptomyces sp. HK10]|uniref:hypothetical protein n=1 Tax=Streptomyces sp. HK10 TaxID=3373255 RepID=UPI0037483F36
MRRHHTEARDETAAWRAVARESLQAFDLIFMPRAYGLQPQDGARRAADHLRAGQALMQPIIDRYVTAARTPMGRAWRRRAAMRGAYVRAFEEALAHALARSADAPEPAWPRLYNRGSLPLIHRHTGDRCTLGEESR